MRSTTLILALAALYASASTAHADEYQLDGLDLSTMTQDYGSPHADRTVDGHPLTIGGRHFDHGIGTHAASDFEIFLDGRATEFKATVGVDDETNGRGSVAFHVIANGKTVAETKVLHGGYAAVDLSVPLAGVHELVLSVTDGGDGIAYDHADWGNAVISYPAGASKPRTFSDKVNTAPRLRIPAVDAHPSIHGARIVGSTPGHPFLYLIPATGQGPLIFSVKNLPVDLKLDAKLGIISGRLKKAGTSTVTLIARGPHGVAKRDLIIVGGKDKLALTPPMGWNSWNAWAGNIDQKKMEAAADIIVNSGLAAHGYTYVNIDDTWEGNRSATGEILSNAKFPSMPALAAYVHARGLKVGLYSSPGPKTCAGYTASYQHEAQDANTWARWGFDYIKYDWCSYSDVPHDPGLSGDQLPYDKLGKALAGVDRDIFYSLCQYGMGDVWKWGASVRGNCWRTTGDINDSWGSLHGILESQVGHEKYAGPGHWNDPDMLVVGNVGWGNPHPTHLKPNEQILHMSMWSMLSAPLIIGCDLTKLDPFTLALLTNDEVIDIDQDPLGHAAHLVSKTAAGEVWARPLFDGSTAVALVNPRGTPQTNAAFWTDLGIHGARKVRDLWLHQDLGKRNGSYSVLVPAHGCVLLKIER